MVKNILACLVGTAFLLLALLFHSLPLLLTFLAVRWMLS